ncbi:tyrosine-type recombinase/integrase [Cyclobacterium sp. SYSU L10401]|uniref:tyrosine-type recombinase/integrase n=1 Tax=Cyclobacterium sp. SYSU L10401 TaxID=2678657 RepID=UPI0013D12CCA|nr:integrase arm-type DNA-binding domain-containing protein [Cyclobacterium sp. SYSU L10401]
MKLSDLKCKSAKPRNKQYKLFDGGGLYLRVRANGSKLWQMKYRYLNKEKTLSIGQYPLISLAQARQARDDAKRLLMQNPPIDPMAHKAENKRQAIRKVENTFKAVALEWHALNKDRWSDNYAYKIQKGLELNVFPHIGSRPIAEITPPELLNDCLKKIEKRGSLDIAGRTRQICGQVFRYGIQTGKCEWNPAENLRGALKTRKTKHFRTLNIKEVPDFLKALERNEARLFERTRRAVWLSLYTFCRPVEIRKARWEDFDFDEALWTIPAEIMKMRREHIVPLSRQALAVLEEQKKEVEILNTPWVFPSQVRPREPMSDGTVNKAIKRLGFGKDMVAHGFRALARTTIREKLHYDSEAIECQLAHKAAGPLGEAYNRTQFLDVRKIMMQDWSDYLDALA